MRAVAVSIRLRLKAEIRQSHPAKRATPQLAAEAFQKQLQELNVKVSPWKWTCPLVVITALSLGSVVNAQTSSQMGAAQAPPSSALAGRVYHVSPMGNDTAEGSEMQPWKTIQKAAETLTAGDTVMIAAGVYRERVAARKSGEAGRPISYIASAGAVIDGLNAPGWNLFDTNHQSYINISGLKVQNALPEGSGIHVARSKHIRVERCHTSETADSGIKVDFSSNVSVLNNEVEKGCQRGGEETISVKRSEYVEVNNNHVHHTKHEGIDVKEGARHVNVIGNYIHHVERQGLYADAWNKPTFNIRFFNNIVHDSGFGFMLSSERAGLLSDVWFCNNVIYNNAGPGMGVAAWGEEYVTPATAQITKKNLYFVNNTIVNNGKPGSPWGGGMYLETAKVDNLVVKNNILSGNSGAPILSRDGKRPPNAIIMNNLVFGEGNINQPGIGNVTGDPLFVNAAKGDFRLRKGSPSINVACQTMYLFKTKMGDCATRSRT
jgi:hypothetical protein